MKTFEELGIQPNIIRAIKELGFENPMPVQEEVIPLLLAQETDVVALAQTGTGKTAAFGLPVIQQIDLSVRQPQALILSPTRELCVQICDDLTDFSKYIEPLKLVPVYGGASIDNQIKLIKQGVHIIVATPGRLIDLIERKVIKMDKITKVILDEADEMLNMGFSESIDQILSHMPQERNTLLFSATMPPPIAAIARKYMNRPKEITIGNKNSGAENVKHVCYTVHAKDKYATLKRIADYYPSIYGIVFCRTRRETQEVADKLITDGYNAEALHGDLSQSQRDFVMQKFRIRNIQLLVATDVAARGIDVEELTHVINYNLPDDIAAYTHRSGRTGRAGKTGISIAIINMREKSLIRQIEKQINKQFVLAKVPSGTEVCEKQLIHLIEKLERVEIEHTDIAPFLQTVYRKLEWIDKEELIQRLVSVEFNRFLQYYRNAPDLNQEEERPRRDRPTQSWGEKGSSRSERGGFSQQQSSGDFTSIYINLGKLDGMHPAALLDIVRKQSGGKVNIGRIDILKKHATFEVDNDSVTKVLRSFTDLVIDNRRIFVKVDEASSQRPSGRPSGRPRMRTGEGRR